jgi:hypothetical protein
VTHVGPTISARAAASRAGVAFGVGVGVATERETYRVGGPG